MEDLTLDLQTADWIQSPYSGPDGGDCVEIAKLRNGQVGVRDSKNPDGPALVFTPTEWNAFTRWLRTDTTI